MSFISRLAPLSLSLSLSISYSHANARTLSLLHALYLSFFLEHALNLAFINTPFLSLSCLVALTRNTYLLFLSHSLTARTISFPISSYNSHSSLSFPQSHFPFLEISFVRDSKQFFGTGAALAEICLLAFCCHEMKLIWRPLLIFQIENF